jgi:ATP-dependent DNA helicase RecG
MQEKNISLTTPVRYFKGVGPKRSEILSRIGIHTAEDVLYYLPFRYEDRSDIIAIKDLKTGESQTVRGDIVNTTTRLTKAGGRVFQAAITDRTGTIHAVWFNQPYLKDYLQKGQNVILYGKVERYDKLQIMQPEYEILEEAEIDSLNIGRIVPIYPLTEGITERYLRNLADEAISRYVRQLKEVLPTYLLAREKLVDIKFAIKNIHFPTAFENLEKAYRRIVFEEFLMLQLALAIKKREMKEDAGLRHKVAGELIGQLKNTFSFELTDAQKNVIKEIERDMSSAKPMNRLLEGDVGSGKTIVAAHAIFLTVHNGFQAVMMAPTEVLARQHFIVFSEIFMPLGINVGLLVGGLGEKARAEVYADIKSGKIDVIVGTHAIIQESVEFAKLGIAVIDEQHKFGVTQRAVLKQKGYRPHVLVMTATPIPRTLALTVYGDLDVSIISEMPKGRIPIATYWVEEEKRSDVYNFIKEELDKGRQAYVVCPLIGRGPASCIRAPGAVETFEKFKNDIFLNHTVGLLHGRMGADEKDSVMSDFKKRKIDVLVSTVVIEVGIDVPNASVMLVESADRFGLSQLHQLRGRVGRGKHESYCILLADPKTDEAKRRLQTIEKTLDGFEIAEEDLDMRGPGEFFGTRQHGLPEIRFGNILKDFDIMEAARKEAFNIIAKDPDLSEEHHRLLKNRLSARFKGKMDLIKVG